MAGAGKHEEFETARIMLGLLERVERNGAQTQRGLASELGIALGLVNAYLKRCVRKGFIKMTEAPARRYAYYLTPRGFTEKSRLTIHYLSYSLSVFRQARSDYANVMNAARTSGFLRIVLAGVSDLAEIAVICAISEGIQIVGIVDPDSTHSRFIGFSVFSTFDLIRSEFDAVVVTDIKAAREIYGSAVERFGMDRVLVPSFLGLSPGRSGIVQ
jgi:hypothetical protein